MCFVGGVPSPRRSASASGVRAPRPHSVRKAFSGSAVCRPTFKIPIYTDAFGRLIAPVPGSTPPTSAQFKLVMSSDALPSSDQRWRNQVDQLLGDLKRNAGEVRKEITPVDGQKGGAEAIILALGSSG